MAYSDYYEKVQEIYLAYYGRTADLDGLAYWSARLDQEEGALGNIIEAFASSQEAQNRYGNLSNSDKITAIYQSLYERDPDPGGLAFYLDELEQGEMTQATIMLNVLDGSTGDDLARINGIVESAMDDFNTEQLRAAASDHAEEMEPTRELPTTLRLSNDKLYEVVAGSGGDDRLVHNSGNKIYLGLGGDDQLKTAEGSTGSAILVGGSGNDTYDLHIPDLVVVNDVGGGYDTLNNREAGAPGYNYTVDGHLYGSDLYDDAGYTGTALLGDISSPQDRIEEINQVGQLDSSFSQEQFIEVTEQLSNWQGDLTPAEAGLSGYDQDLTALAGLNAQYEEVM